MEEEEFYRSKRRYKPTKKKINLDKVSLPETIKDEMLKIYQAFQVETHHGTRQKQILYACAYLASLNQKIPFIPGRVARALDLDPKKITGATNFINTARNIIGLCDEKVFFDPFDFVKLYLVEKKDFEIDYHRELYDLYLSTANGKLLNTEPILIAAIFLHKYKLGTRKELSEFFEISEINLRKNDF